MIFVVGYAGSGKSSMGRRLARRLNMGFVDTDRLVEQMVGASIADIFHYEGEEYFRNAEREAIEHVVASHDDVIVATGGGLPTWRDNMPWMKRHGFVVYLRRRAEQIIARMSAHGRERRPLFSGKSDEELLDFMHTQMAQREAYYAQAHLAVDCTSLSDEKVIEHIVNQIVRHST